MQIDVLISSVIFSNSEGLFEYLKLFFQKWLDIVENGRFSPYVKRLSIQKYIRLFLRFYIILGKKKICNMTDDSFCFKKWNQLFFAASILRKIVAWTGRITLYEKTKKKRPCLGIMMQGAQLRLSPDEIY